MRAVQSIRDLVGQVRVYGSVAHLEAVQIPRVPVTVVDVRLVEMRKAQYLSCDLLEARSMNSVIRM